MKELFLKFAALGDAVQSDLDVAQDHCNTPEIPFIDALPFLESARDKLNEMIEVGKEIDQKEKAFYGETD